MHYNIVYYYIVLYCARGSTLLSFVCMWVWTGWELLILSRLFLLSDNRVYTPYMLRLMIEILHDFMCQYTRNPWAVSWYSIYGSCRVYIINSMVVTQRHSATMIEFPGKVRSCGRCFYTPSRLIPYPIAKWSSNDGPQKPLLWNSLYLCCVVSWSTGCTKKQSDFSPFSTLGDAIHQPQPPATLA